MADDFLDPGGIIVPVSSLRLPRARSLVEALQSKRLDFASFVECRQAGASPEDSASETVVVDLEVERPQERAHDIRRIERVAVRFSAEDNWYPEVLALRPDFPRVPHINIRDEEFPRSLCLYDQPWEQIALRWTPSSFIEQIRYWLSETAKGSLHQADQPLEPMLLGGGWKIILSSDIFEGNNEGEMDELKVTLASPLKHCGVLIGERADGKIDGGLPFLAISFVAQAQTHGTIRRKPTTLQELDEFLKSCGINLVENLRSKLNDWDSPDLRNKCLLIVVAFPLMRQGFQTVEATDLWAFATFESIEETGIAIGFWEKAPGAQTLGRAVAPKPDADGRSIKVDVISPSFKLTRNAAAAASGFSADSRRVTAIGVGAIGSQVVKLLAQSGFGKWTLIDDDVLLPHNLARHALGPTALGWPKTVPIAWEIGQLYREEEPPESIEANLLHPFDKKEKIVAALSNSDLIFDFSASIPVARHLVHDCEGKGRRISFFTNPTGTDAVLLAEDATRSIPLDCLEMQYYRAVLNNPKLESHLEPPAGRVRYARSCRDVTSTIPNYLVAMHAAIGSKAIRQASEDKRASIILWQADAEKLKVQEIRVKALKIHKQAMGDWTLVVDDYVIDRLAKLRLSKLPKETGGVLIGSYDLVRRIVYVVDTIPSPPDSKEWPTLYIRGSAGLFTQIEKVGRLTDGQLEYIGEWHSHPDGIACLPSEDDLLVFSWLTQHMADAGLPALMAIVGQNRIAAWYLGQMVRAGGWQVGNR